MQYNKEIHRRRSIRLKDYDYSQAGAYFVTICTWDRECLFGEVVENVGARGAVTVTNEYGEIVKSEWMKTADIRANVELDEFIVMPNHVHGIIVITHNENTVGARRCPALNSMSTLNEPAKTDSATRRENENRVTHRVAPTVISGSIGAIIGQFKSIVRKRINRLRNIPGRPVWQRNYYEHVIRDIDEMNRIREYIINNPAQWAEDENNPVNMKPVP